MTPKVSTLNRQDPQYLQRNIISPEMFSNSKRKNWYFSKSLKYFRIDIDYIILSYIGMLEQERKKASFNKRDLSHLIYGGKEGLETFQKQQAIFDNDPVLRFDPSFLHRSR